MATFLRRLSSTGSVVKTFECFDPSRLRRHFEGRPVLALEMSRQLWDGKANTFRTGRGPDPGRGWILLRRSDLDATDINATHQLIFTDALDGKRESTVTTQKLIIRYAQNVTPGVPDDTDAIFLTELADLRHVAKNQYYSNPVNRHFNVRAPAGGDNTYYVSSLNGGTAWTWQTLLDRLWNDVNVSELGSSPTLPRSFNGTPENFRWVGLSAWDAYNEVLERLCLTFTFDRDGNPQLVEDGDDDAAFDTATLANRKYLIWDDETIESARGRTPAQAKVYFHRTEKHYGTEQTTPADATQWSTSPVRIVTVADPDSTVGTQSNSTVVLFDDMPALIDNAGTVTNQAALNSRATERANDFYSSLAGGKMLRRTYSGFLNDAGFRPGKQVAGVAWRDLGVEMGQVTDLVRNVGILRVKDDGDWEPIDRVDVNANLRTTDMGRHTLPVYPHLIQEVRVDSTEGTADGLRLGYVQRANPDTLAVEDAEQCWLMGANAETLVSDHKYAKCRLWGSREDTLAGVTYNLPFYRTSCDCPTEEVGSTSGSASGSGRGPLCVEVVRDVNFNPVTCILTVEKITICFPNCCPSGEEVFVLGDTGHILPGGNEGDPSEGAGCPVPNTFYLTITQNFAPGNSLYTELHVGDVIIFAWDGVQWVGTSSDIPNLGTVTAIKSGEELLIVRSEPAGGSYPNFLTNVILHCSNMQFSPFYINVQSAEVCSFVLSG